MLAALLCFFVISVIFCDYCLDNKKYMKIKKIVIYGFVCMRSQAVSHDRNEPTTQIVTVISLQLERLLANVSYLLALKAVIVLITTTQCTRVEEATEPKYLPQGHTHTLAAARLKLLI